ncbi:hypothetical protein [Chryseobacterium daeguense]|uniref:hypothetical protein n=1 Tax=Chryseobacterium daeguense TaxID=412438 RepID=UPI0012DC4A33|nr:hypothetical protein [Chryseobacterium daeguense]
MKKLYYHKVILFTALVCTVLLNSCSSTHIASSWRDPDKQIHPTDWKKVLVMALLRNETNRRSAEDEMAEYLDGKGITSYSYLDENFNRKDEQALRSRIKKDGFDAAITMRLIDVDKEKVYTPQQYYMYPMYYNDFITYYYRNWMYYNIPGNYTITKKFIIETIIYSIKDDKIIWSGITETYDPKGVKRLTNEIARALRNKMQQEGFIEK